MADHVEADAGAFLLQVGHAEFAGLSLDGIEHKGGFRATRAFDLGGAFFKFGARAVDDGEKEVQPRGQVVFAFLPALGTALQGIVVIFLRFFGESFQADVAAHFVTVLVQRQQGEESGHAPVAVAEGMDAGEVQHQRGGGDERWDVFLFQGMAVEQAEFIHGGGCLFGRDAFEANLRRLAGVELNDFVVEAFELANVATPVPADCVRVFQGGGIDGDAGGFGVDFIQGAPAGLLFNEISMSASLFCIPANCFVGVILKCSIL